MARIVALLFMVSLSTGALAQNVSGSWFVLLSIFGPGMEVAPSGDYCLVPAALNVQPRRLVVLSDEEGIELESTELLDAVEFVGDQVSPGDICSLVGGFFDVPAHTGYNLRILSQDPHLNAEESGMLKLVWSFSALSGFDVSYDESGIKTCDFAIDSPIHLGAQVRSLPQSNADDGDAELAKGEVTSSSFGDSCLVSAELEVPISAEYELVIGDALLSSEFEEVVGTPSSAQGTAAEG